MKKHTRPILQTNQSSHDFSSPLNLNALQNKKSLSLSSRQQQNLNGKNKSLSKQFGSHEDLNIEGTTQKLTKTNFSQHDPNFCVCDSCMCRRHMRNLKIVKPDMRKSSIYKQSFQKSQIIPNKVNISKETEKLLGPHIGMNSVQRQSFDGKIGDKYQRRRPEDLINLGGPSQHLTSYKSGYPGHICQNQYIKPVFKATSSTTFPGPLEDNRQPVPLKTTYGKSFANLSGMRSETGKVPDNLKSSVLWMGKSSYENFFQTPNPEHYSPKAKNIEKLENNPNYSRQFETTYKQNFLKNTFQFKGKNMPQRFTESSYSDILNSMHLSKHL